MTTSTRTSVQPLLVSPTEAATILGVSRPMIYKMFAAGQLRRIHVGRSAKVRIDEVYALAGGAPASEITK